MSVWKPAIDRGDSSAASARKTIPTLLAKKRAGTRIAAVTAYDVCSARLCDAAGLDVVLVGDSLAMTMLGYDNTLPVTMDEMIVLTSAVRRGLKHALLVADMPFGSYLTEAEGLANAVRFVKQAGAEAVKLEGGRDRAHLVERLVQSEIPVMGHLGLTPQSVHRMGGYKVQGKTTDSIERLREDAHLLAGAGCFAIVLEGIPREVARTLTRELPIPTIGIGAGPDCDGQILVWHDLMGLTPDPAKFVRRFAEAGTLMQSALEQYRAEVEAGNFPDDQESYHLPRAHTGTASADTNPVVASRG